jgi:hypothetical protein
MSNQLIIQSGLIFFFLKKKPTAQARAEGKPISGAEFTNRGLSITKLANEMLLTRKTIIYINTGFAASEQKHKIVCKDFAGG